MQTLTKMITESQQQRRPVVLSTIVRHDGSTPRGAGSQMLVSENGLLAGTIGGGVVEARSIETAQNLLVKQASKTEGFALTAEKPAGLDMPCGGDVVVLHSLIEPADEQWAAIAKSVLACFENERPATLLFELPDEDGLEFLGRVCLVDNEGKLVVGKALPSDARAFELPLPLPQRAIVFGGGHVAQAVVPALASVGFSCTVFECREGFLTTERFPKAHKLLMGDYFNVGDTIDVTERDFVIIMTHAHVNDFAIAEQVLGEKPAYLGFMGSTRKIATLHKRLTDAGYSEEEIATIHAPIGVEIEAETPAEIGISVAAECILERAKMQG